MSYREQFYEGEIDGKTLLDVIDEKEAETQALREEVADLRRFAGEIYQVLGALDAPENVLDNASDAANGDKLRHKTLLPFAALRARVVVPDGYALVPVEPTREMFIAVNKEDDKAYAGGCDHGAQFDWLWDAALEAAPRLNGKAVSDGLLRSACSSITRLILSAQTRPSCQKGMVDPCRCHRCNVDRALKVDAELRALLGEGKEHE